MSPSYRKTLSEPIWAVYDGQSLVATCRAPDLGAAKDKLRPFAADGRRRLRRIGAW